MSIYQQYSRSNPYRSRKQIFSQYKLPQSEQGPSRKKQISQQKKDKNEILMKQLGLFKFNISAVLQQKNDLLNRFKQLSQSINKVNQYLSIYNQCEGDQIKEVQRQFKSLSFEQDEIMVSIHDIQGKKRKQLQSDQYQFFLSILAYKQLIKMAQSLQYQAKVFRLGTLSNYNPSNTKANFTKSPQQSENSISIYIKQISKKCSKLMQSKFRYENKNEDDRFLMEDQKYQNCLKQTQELYNPKRVEQIHFQMLNVLQNFDIEVLAFASIVESNKHNCQKYQGVLDSYNLMKKQTQQIDQIIKSRDQIISTLTTLKSSSQDSQFQRIQSIVNKSVQDQKVIQKNIKIYKINQKVYSLYNTQTNLRVYYNQRNKYSIKLRQLQNRLNRWEHQHQMIKLIFEKYNSCQNLLKKKQYIMKDNRNIIELSQINKKSQRYFNQLQIINIKKQNPLNQFKNVLLSRLNNMMGKQDVKRFYRQSKNNESQNQDYLRIQVYQNLFKRLSKVDSNKKHFLVQNKNNIENYIQYNQNKLSDIRQKQLYESISKYNYQLKICQSIINTVELFQNLLYGNQELAQEQVNLNFIQILKKHLYELADNKKNYGKFMPSSDIGKWHHYHIHDYTQLYQTITCPIWRQFLTSLQKLKPKQPVQIRTDQSLKQKTHILNKYIATNLSTFYNIKLFCIIINKFLSYQVNPQLYNSFQNYYWSLICNFIKEFYKSNFKGQQKLIKGRIDKNVFLSIPILISLVENYMSVKVINLEEILLKIFDQIENEIHNMNEDGLIVNVINLSLLLEYIRSIEKYRQPEYKIYQNSLSRLRRLLSINLFKSQYFKAKQLSSSEDSIISTMLSLQKTIRYQDYTQPARQPLQSMHQNKQFTNQVQNYLQSIQKQISTLLINISQIKKQKINVYTVYQIFNFPQRFNSYQFQSEISTLAKQKQLALNQNYIYSYFNIEEQTLIRLDEVTELEWKQNENVIVKIRNKKNYYFKYYVDKIKLLKKQKVFEQYVNLVGEVKKKLESNQRVSGKEYVRKFDQRVFSTAKKVLESQKKLENYR